LTILVLGNATVDFSYEVERLPIAGETLLASSKFIDAGGKGLNQAVVAHRAGAQVRLCAAIGNDAHAEIIAKHVMAEELDAGFLLRHAGPTDESLIFIAPSGENAIVSTAGAARGLAADAAQAAFARLESGDSLLMQGNLSQEITHHALETARARSVCAILNPAPIAFDYTGLWPFVDIAIVNEVEAAALGSDTDLDSAALRLLKAGCKSVIVTLGGAGARLYERDYNMHVTAPLVTAVDTTGAGDVFCGVLAAGIAQGMAMNSVIRWSVAAASLSVTRRGTGAAFPSRDELRELRSAANAAA
jgi:ribokinase